MKKNSAPFGASDKDIEAAGKALGKVMRSKGKKKYFLLALIVIVAVVAALTKTGVLPDVVGTGETVTAAPASSAADTLEVNYIDVGQGDCTLIICGGQTMLIDAGENGHEEKVISYLHSKDVGKLDYLVCSHQHTDHMGGLPEVLDEFGAFTVIMPRLTKAQTPTNKTYTAFLNSVKASGAKVEAAQPGNSYTLGSAKFEMLGPVADDAESLNNMSAVLMLTFEGKKFLFTGDAEREEELEMLAEGRGFDCDVLKVGHHGSKTSSSADFLAAATPEICVIECGADNDYGHPHKQVLERIKEYTSEIYRTDICGDIVITCSGGELNITYERQ